MHNRLGRRFQRRLDVPVWLERGPQGLSYSEKVVGYGPIRYWPMTEETGTNAEELIVGDDATYGRDVAVMGTGEGIGDGNTAPIFDGANDQLNIYSLALSGAWNPEEGAMNIWCRVANVGVWTDATSDFIWNMIPAYNALIRLRKTDAANRLEYFHFALPEGETSKSVATSTIDWFAMGLVWSNAGDYLRAYLNGIQQGGDENGLGTIAGALDAFGTKIGAEDGAPSAVWNGRLAHPALWDSPQPDEVMLDLGTV